MDMALEAAQNMEPGETILESQLDDQSDSDDLDDDDNYDGATNTDGSSVITPDSSRKHPYLGSGLSSEQNIQNQYAEMNDGEIEIQEIEENNVEPLPRALSANHNTLEPDFVQPEEQKVVSPELNNMLANLEKE